MAEVSDCECDCHNDCHCDLLSELLSTEKHSDMELQHPEKTFRLHKAVVFGQSPVMAAAFKEGFQESATGVLKVDSSFSLETVQRMVQYFYMGTYFDSAHSKESLSTAVDTTSETSVYPHPAKRVKTSPGDATTRSQLAQHLRVYEIADYYDIKALRNLVIKKIGRLFQISWSAETFLDVVTGELSEANDATLLKMLAKTMIANFQELSMLDKFGNSMKNPLLAVSALNHGFTELERVLEEATSCAKAIDHKQECQECFNRKPVSVKKIGEGYSSRIVNYCQRCGEIV